jgi:hypothetical protein
MKPLELKIAPLEEWKRTSWFEYASESREYRIKLLCNLTGHYRVMQGNILYWEGTDPVDAIKHFHEA